MTLIILLVLLLAERILLHSPKWQVSTYFNKYVLKALPYVKARSEDSLSLFLFVALPSISAAVFLYLFDSKVINFLVSLLVLAVCIGNEKVRYYYRQYLNASERQDKEAQDIIHAKMAMVIKARNNNFESGSSAAEPTSASDSDNLADRDLPPMSHILIWSNFKYYAAPIFYFVLFGVPGVIFYTTLLYLVETIKLEKLSLLNDHFGESLPVLEKWQGWLDWLPARFVSTGFMFVGKFSDALDVWIKQAANFSVSARNIICQVAEAAELDQHNNELQQVFSMVKLAKRNMILFLVAVALLTIYGLIL